MTGKTVASVLESKEIQGVVSVAPSATVRDAVSLMSERAVGAVLVVSASGTVEGIFTERDVVRRVVDEGRDPRTTAMTAVMSPNVRRIAASADIEEALTLMIVHRHRHLLVDDGNDVRGLVSIRDLMYWLVLPVEPAARDRSGAIMRARGRDALLPSAAAKRRDVR